MMKKYITKNKNEYTHRIIRNGEDDIYLKIDNIDDFWHIVDEQQDESNSWIVAEALPYKHPIIFQVKMDDISSEGIFNMCKMIQKAMLKVMKNDKLEVSCMGWKRDESSICILFDKIGMTNEAQSGTLCDSISKECGIHLNRTIYEKEWIISMFADTEEIQYYPNVISGSFFTCESSKIEGIRHLEMRLNEYANDNIIKKETKSEKKEKIAIEKSRETYSFVTYNHKFLMKYISKNRLKVRTEWEDIGSALYRCDVVEGLDLWMEWSKDNEELYNECQDVWMDFKFTCDEPKTAWRFFDIKTLIWYALKDSEDFRKIFNDNTKEHIRKCIGPKSCHKHIAEMIASQLFLEHEYLGDDTWASYRNGKWDVIKKGEVVLAAISDKIMPLIAQVESEIIKDIMTLKGIDPTNPKLAILESDMKACNDLYKAMGTPSKKNSALVELQQLEVMESPIFEQKKNKEHERLPFLDGVYNLENKEFTEYKPQDYWDSRINYKFHSLDKTKDIENANSYFEKVYVNPKIREGLFSILTPMLARGNRHKMMLVLLGETTNNSKTTFFNIFEICLGELVRYGDSNILTSPPPSAESPQPALMSLNGSRVALFAECRGKLDDGTVKLLTGGEDEKTIRTLHQKKMTRMKFDFNGITSCNKVLETKDSTGVTTGRLYYIDHQSQFVQDAPEDIIEQKKQRKFQ